MNIVLSVCVLLSLKSGFCLESTGTCMPFCSETDCITLNHDRVDFKTAEEACRGRNGELATFQSEAEKDILDILGQELRGNVWIGLRLPAGACSNLSAPMRGYKWTSSGVHSNFMPPSTTWRDTKVVCSPHCVSLSSDQKWTERPCKEKTDGYLCRAKHGDACRAQELSDSNFFKSSKGCSAGPCEHVCTDVEGGFRCSCFEGYRPDSRDPRQCQMHCVQEKCRAICDRNTGDSCSCPNGYLFIGSYMCEDIDECSMSQCHHYCRNTFGGFVCSCQEGFVLKDEVRCIKALPAVMGDAKPAANNSTTPSAAASGFLWIWIVTAVAVLVIIFVIRFYVVRRQSRREQSPAQQSTAALHDVEA